MPRSKQEAKKRKKWRGHVLKDSPFPVPIRATMAEAMPQGAWFYYTGYIEGSTVVVKHTGDMDFLHKMGFFGKGTLSRSEPSFHERKQRVNIRVPAKGGFTKPPALVKAVVTNKRNYLTHKRYKALLEGNGTEYNYIMHCEEQQKLGLEGLSDGEDGNKDEEEEEEEDEDEGDSEDGGGSRRIARSSKSSMMEAYHMLSGGENQSKVGLEGAESSLTSGQQFFSEASKETRSAVVALLSEIAALSNEKIATFAEVPHNLGQLRGKYEMLRQAEISLVHGQQAHLFQSRSRSFGQGEVIELDDIDDDGGGGEGGGDSVVVLDSDDEDDGDGDDSNMEKKSVEPKEKEKNSGKGANGKAKGWDDYDEEDLDCWGSADGKTKDTSGVKDSEAGSATTDRNGSEQQGNAVMVDKREVSKDSKTIKLGGNGKTAEGGRISEDGTEKPLAEDTHLPNGESSVKDKADMADTSADAGDGKHGKVNASLETSSDSSLKISGEEGKTSKEVGMDESGTKKGETTTDDVSKNRGLEIPSEDDGATPVADLPAGSVKKPSVGVVEMMSEDSSSSAHSGASDDSDDVICIESESAAPSKVHNFLSQGAESRKVVVTKAVTFMSNITAQPSYVNAKVGFTSWNSLIHFNYSGDPTHLPTVMAAESRPSASKSTSSSRTGPETDGVKSSQQVYERLFPPVTTLLPGLKSQGAMIKQRLKGLPCLSSAYLKVSMLGVPALGSATAGVSGDSTSIVSASGSHSLKHQRQRQQQQLASQPSAVQQSLSSTTVASSHSSVTSVSHSTHSPIVLGKKSTVSSVSSFQTPLVLNYLKAFNVYISENSSENSHNGEENSTAVDTGNCLDCVLKLSDLYVESGSKTGSSLSESPEVSSVLSQFHSALSERLSGIALVPEEEPSLLKMLLSGTDIREYFSGSEVVECVKKLTEFQTWLLNQRLKHVTRQVDRGGDNSGGVGKKRRNSSLEGSENGDPKRLKSAEVEQAESAIISDDLPAPHDNKSVNNSIEQGSEDTLNKPSDFKMGASDIASEVCADAKKENRGNEINGKNDSLGESKDEKETVSDPGTKGNFVQVAGPSGDSAELNSPKVVDKSKRQSGGKDPSNSGVDQICIGSSSEEEDEVSSDDSVEVTSAPTLDARSLCRTDEPEGDLFVINNTSEEEELEDELEEEEEEDRAIRTAHQWRPCVKADPCPVEEQLRLMLEEAFFLSFGLGCLRILDPESRALDLTELWGQFQVLKEQFVPHYVAYHYFRSKGWVPKSGLKFGCDFILYREGPPFYHGSYSVVVQCVQEGSLLPCTRREGYQLDHRHLNWISLAGLNRITEHVAKELMFCYVIWPKGLTQEEITSPACISRFKVKEVLVSRWVSSQERESKTEEEMP